MAITIKAINGLSAAAATPPAWYYSGTGTNAITSEPTWDILTNSYSAAYAEGAPVKVGQTGNITKIAIKCKDIGAGSLKIALFTNVASPVRLSTGGTVTLVNDSTTAWREITLGSSVAVTSGDIIQVWLSVDGAIGQSCEITGADLYYYTEGAPTTYNNFPKATSPAYSTAANRRQAARVYVE